MTEQIGIVGAGVMGKELVTIFSREHILLGFYDLRDDDALHYSANGAYRKTSIFDLRDSTFIFLCLPTSEAVEKSVDLILDSRIDWKNLKGIIDLSTTDPKFANEIFDKCSVKNLEFFECPMIGGVRALKEKRLNVLINSNLPNFKELKKVLNKFCKNIYQFDKVGQPTALKLIHNFITISNSVIAMHALALSEKLEFNKRAFFEIIENGTASSYVVRNTLKRTLLDNDYKEGYKLSLVRKDLKAINKLFINSDMNNRIFDSIFDLLVLFDYEEDMLQTDYPIVYKKLFKNHD